MTLYNCVYCGTQFDKKDGRMLCKECVKKIRKENK